MGLGKETVSIPYTFATGEVIDATKFNDNFVAFKTLLETTLLGVGNLQNQFGTVCLKGRLEGTLPAGTTDYVLDRFYIPAGYSFEPTLASVCHEEELATDVKVKFQAAITGVGDVISGTLETTVISTVVMSTSFALPTVAGGRELVFKLSETGGANDASRVTVTLWGKMKHRE